MPEPARAFASQLARGLSAALARSQAASRPGEVTIRLNPASLGQLKVHVALTRGGDGVAARFEVASPAARRLIQETLAHLRGSLEARGLGVESLEVTLADRARLGSDPLGLLSGTPYAEASGVPHPAAGTPAHAGHGAHGPHAGPPGPPGHGGPGDGGGGQTSGQDARHHPGRQSTDALDASEPPGAAPGTAAAERLLDDLLGHTPYTFSRDEGGALRLAIDAIA